MIPEKFDPKVIVSAMIRNRTSIFARFPTGGWIKIGYAQPHAVTYRGRFFTSIYSATDSISEEDARLVMAFVANLKQNKNISQDANKAVPKIKKEESPDDVMVDVGRVAKIISEIPALSENFPGFDPIKSASIAKTIKLRNRFSRICVIAIFPYSGNAELMYFTDTRKIVVTKTNENITGIIEREWYRHV